MSDYEVRKKVEVLLSNDGGVNCESVHIPVAIYYSHYYGKVVVEGLFDKSDTPEAVLTSESVSSLLKAMEHVEGQLD